MHDALRANAELVVQQLASARGGHFGYDEDSVRWLDGYIGRLRANPNFESAEKRGNLVSVLGSYLGECIIRNFGGSWVKQGGGWCVAFDERNRAFPFAKIEKRFERGDEESIVAFYTAIPVLFRRQHMSPAKKSWWKFWR